MRHLEHRASLTYVITDVGHKVHAALFVSLFLDLQDATMEQEVSYN
jgi:hypothetical protein